MTREQRIPFGAARSSSFEVPVLLLTLAIALVAVPGQSSAHRLATGPEDSVVANWSGYGYNATPCGILAAEYGNFTGIGYASNYTIIFAKICTTPAFVAYYEGMGPSGFFVIGAFGHIGGVPNLTFALNWEGNCTNSSVGLGGTQCVFQAGWVGYLSNNSFSGPYLGEYPAIYAGGPILGPSGSPTTPFPWLTALIAGVAVGTAIGLVVVVAQRRRGLRDAVLREETEPARPSQQEPPAEPVSKESNDTLDDIF